MTLSLIEFTSLACHCMTKPRKSLTRDSRGEIHWERGFRRNSNLLLPPLISHVSMVTTVMQKSLRRNVIFKVSSMRSICRFTGNSIVTGKRSRKISSIELNISAWFSREEKSLPSRDLLSSLTNDRSPLVETLFTRLPHNERTLVHPKGSLALANNGWIWANNPLVDFASAKSRAYLRREV